jgi:DNA replication protein DnaC
VSEPNPAAAAADQQRRYREFLDLLPLALNLAGLPTSEGTRNFSEDQIELRTNTIKHAFKFARQLAKDYIQR